MFLFLWVFFLVLGVAHSENVGWRAGIQGDGWLCVSSSSQRTIRTQGWAVILICAPILEVGLVLAFFFFFKSQLKALAGKVYRPHSFKSKNCRLSRPVSWNSFAEDKEREAARAWTPCVHPPTPGLKLWGSRAQWAPPPAFPALLLSCHLRRKPRLKSYSCSKITHRSLHGPPGRIRALLYKYLSRYV